MATRTLELSDVNLLDHDLFAEREPWDVFELLQREAPVFRHPEPDGDGFWCVTRYDDVVQVLKDTADVLVGGRRCRADRARARGRARGAAQLHGDRPAAALAVAAHVRP